MSRPMSPLLGGVAAALVIGMGLVGVGADLGAAVRVLPLLAVGAGGLGVVGLRGSRRVVAEGPWSASPVPAGRPGPASREPASDARIARALGRVESRELLGSGAFGVGVGFCVLLFLLFGVAWSPENSEPWFDLAPQAPWFSLPLVGMTVVAAHRAVTRARRDGAAEMLDVCPVSPTTRTVGFLLSAATPVAVQVVFLGSLAAGVAVRSPFMYGSLGAAEWLDVGAALVLSVGGVALGVMLGRWVAFGLVPIVAVVGVAIANNAISAVGGHDWNPYNSLSTAPTIEWDSPVFQARPAGWHLVWVIGLTALVSAGALFRDRRDAAIRFCAVAAAVVTLVAGIFATAPMGTGSAERIARAVADPASLQECEPVRFVTVCVYPVHRPLLARVVDDVAPLVAVLPPSVGSLTLRQRYDGELADLPPEVRRRLARRDLRIPPGEIPIGFGEDFADPLSNPAFHLALGAVGLPSRPDAELRPAVTAGQARGVVALWLLTRGRSPAETRDLTTSPNAGSPDPFERGSNQDVGMCNVPPVVWSQQDLRAARSVVAAPDDVVARVVRSDWARWVDPATGTDELLAALGLPEVGPFDRVVARPGSPC